MLLTEQFQVVTQIATGRIVRIDGGVPAKHDKKIYDESMLADSLLPGEFGVADKGYVGGQSLKVPFKGRNLTQE